LAFDDQDLGCTAAARICCRLLRRFTVLVRPLADGAYALPDPSTFRFRHGQAAGLCRRATAHLIFNDIHSRTIINKRLSSYQGRPTMCLHLAEDAAALP